jgi:spore maturation protein CgeB
VTDYQPHVILHLHGFPMRFDPRIYTVGWIYGHPDRLTKFELAQYDHLFCYSSLYQRELERLGYKSDLMIGATSKLPRFPQTKRYPATFVGNARETSQSRPVVEALLETREPFLVWGNGWNSRLTSENLMGDYIDYHQLDELYAASEFTLNDHHPDMSKWGFVSFRIFDSLASGGFVLSDRNAGLEEIFGDTVPQYSNGKELGEIMAHFRAHPEEKEILRSRGAAIALSHIWEDRARQIYSHLMEVSQSQRQSEAAVAV